MRKRGGRAATVLRTELESQNIAVEEIASWSGIPVPTFRDRMTGRSEFYVAELAMICATLGIDLHTFMVRVALLPSTSQVPHTR